MHCITKHTSDIRRASPSNDTLHANTFAIPIVACLHYLHRRTQIDRPTQLGSKINTRAQDENSKMDSHDQPTEQTQAEERNEFGLDHGDLCDDDDNGYALKAALNKARSNTIVLDDLAVPERLRKMVGLGKGFTITGNYRDILSTIITAKHLVDNNILDSTRKNRV